MGREIALNKVLLKKHFTVGEEVLVKVIIKNIGNYKIENLSYEEEIKSQYELRRDSVKIDGFSISLRERTNRINLGDIKIGEEKMIEFSLKIVKLDTLNKIRLCGRVKYEYYGDEKEEQVYEDIFLKDCNVEVIEFKRDKDIVFSDEGAMYTFKIENKGNIVASNIYFKYKSGTNFKGVIGSLKIDEEIYKIAKVEKGINLGILKIGEIRKVRFMVKRDENLKISKEEKEKIEISYDFVDTEKESLKHKEIILEKKKIIFVDNSIKCEIMIEKNKISKKEYVKVDTIIENNTFVDIKNLKVCIEANMDLRIEDIKIDSDGKTVIEEGNSLVISSIKDKEKIILSYKLLVNGDKVYDKLELFNSLIYNLRYGDTEKRFEKRSNLVKIDLDFKKIIVDGFINRDSMHLNETFLREIKIKNISDTEVYRINLFDKASEEIEILKGSFTIDDKVINSIDNLSDGITIDEIKSLEEISVKYRAKFKKLETTSKSIDFFYFAQYLSKGEDNNLVKSILDERKNSLRILGNSLSKRITKKVDVKKFKIKEIVDASGICYVESVKVLNGMVEIPIEARIVKTNSANVSGYIEINLEYLNTYENEKIKTLNIRVGFNETVDFLKILSSGERVWATCEVKNIIIKLEEDLNIAMTLEISIV